MIEVMYRGHEQTFRRCEDLLYANTLEDCEARSKWIYLNHNMNKCKEKGDNQDMKNDSGYNKKNDYKKYAKSAYLSKS